MKSNPGHPTTPPGSAAATESVSRENHLAYVRLRSPQLHGQALDVPRGVEVDRQFASNVSLRSTYRSSLATSAAIARQQLLDAASCYTRSYLPQAADWIDRMASVSGALGGANRQRVVMAGHQPSLFHPGVWYKNFRLDALAGRFQAIGINLVVDNDLLISPSIGCPHWQADATFDSPQRSFSQRPFSLPPAVSVRRLKFDDAFATTPHEIRPIVNAERFEGFSNMVADAIKSVTGLKNDSPIMGQLWPEVLIARESLGNDCLGRVIAAGRHRLEWKLGLRTLEVPVGTVAATQAFGAFTQQVLADLQRFATLYNGVLNRYRQQYAIRSTSHPVPALATIGSCQEAPFWVWTPADGQRRPLFVSRDETTLVLTDRNRWEAKVALGDWQRWWSDEVQTQRVSIRPRALTTTMFHRLFGCDLFIHGIGGAKYDQLTDQIIEEFYGVRPPEYSTSTATFVLPFDADRVSSEDISRQQQKLRALRYHPENYVDRNPETLAMIEEKENAVDRMLQLQGIKPQTTTTVNLSSKPGPNSGPNSGPDPAPKSKPRITAETPSKIKPRRADGRSPKKVVHDQIEAINRRLFERLQKQSAALEATIERLKTQQKTSQILFSREYSFTLHRIGIVAQLKRLANE